VRSKGEREGGDRRGRTGGLGGDVRSAADGADAHPRASGDDRSGVRGFRISDSDSDLPCSSGDGYSDSDSDSDSDGGNRGRRQSAPKGLDPALLRAVLPTVAAAFGRALAARRNRPSGGAGPGGGGQREGR
jgi:hypothetical protein